MSDEREGEPRRLTEAAMLAADVAAMEFELDDRSREIFRLRVMVSVSLAIAAEALLQLERHTS